MATFPTSIISTANLVNPTSTQPTNNPSHTGAHVLLNGELIAIETLLVNNFRVNLAPVNSFFISSGGSVGIGTVTPTAKLHVLTLTSFTSNTAAIAGGLTVGAFYRNVDNVCVVH